MNQTELACAWLFNKVEVSWDPEAAGSLDLPIGSSRRGGGNSKLVVLGRGFSLTAKPIFLSLLLILVPHKKPRLCLSLAFSAWAPH